MSQNNFHSDLSLGRWLPRGLGSPLLVWLSRHLHLPTPAAKVPPHIVVEERTLDPATKVGVEIIRPRPDGKKRPALLWIHGGGYIIGSAKQDRALCARFAAELDAVVVSADYRLAPEHPYPTPLEDCFAAFELMHREADALGIDPTRIVIGGASAGGGLAAALTLLVHDRKRPAPVLQLLVYPMLDDRTVLRRDSNPLYRLWNPSSNQYGWRSYLGRAPGGPGVNDHAAAARRADLSGLPPAWIGVGSLDLFHDEDVAYAERLREAGVPTELEIVDGAFHGFDLVMSQKPVSRRFFAAQIAAIKARIGTR